MYDLILADPPWRYAFSNSRSRTIERRYPTMSQQDICEMGAFVRSLANADGCILMLWATAPKLRQAFEVIDAWGWVYKTFDPWDKKNIGRGYYWRGRHELLLLCTRGDTKTPPTSRRPDGGMYEKRRDHSRKPECSYERIEFMYPHLTKAELFARPPFHKGWDVAGADVPAHYAHRIKPTGVSCEKFLLASS